MLDKIGYSSRQAHLGTLTIALIPEKFCKTNSM